MSGRRFTRDGGVSTSSRGNGSHSAIVGTDFAEARKRQAYLAATQLDIDFTKPAAQAPKAKSKREPKVKSTETVHANLVADTAVRAVTSLAAACPAATYDDLRAITCHAIYIGFAVSLGMNVPGIDDLLAEHAGGAPEFCSIVAGLPYGELTPEHFGSAHEALSGYQLVDGKIVSSSERRTGGVHFTPRAMVEPIVLKTLEPLLRVRGIVGESGIPKTSTQYPYPDPNGPADAAAALLAAVVHMPTPRTVMSLRIGDPAVGGGAFPLTIVRVLGALLAAAFRHHGGAPDDEHLDNLSKQLVAVHCVHAVDVSPFGVASTKLALTLECRADTLPTNWLSNNIRCGDALVGALNHQLVRFHWGPKDDDAKGGATPIVPELAALVDQAMTEGANFRRAHILVDASPAVERARIVGDLLIGAFFAHAKDKDRESERLRRLTMILAWLASGEELPGALAEMRDATARLRPFHWHIEFPEVYAAERGGGPALYAQGAA